MVQQFAKEITDQQKALIRLSHDAFKHQESVAAIRDEILTDSDTDNDIKESNIENDEAERLMTKRRVSIKERHAI